MGKRINRCIYFLSVSNYQLAIEVKIDRGKIREDKLVRGLERSTSPNVEQPSILSLGIQICLGIECYSSEQVWDLIRLLNGLLLLLDYRLDDWLGNLLNWSRSAGNKIKLVLQSHISFDLKFRRCRNMGIQLEIIAFGICFQGKEFNSKIFIFHFYSGDFILPYFRRSCK